MTKLETGFSSEPEPGASAAAARGVRKSFAERLPRRLYGFVKAVTGAALALTGVAVVTGEHVTGLNLGLGTGILVSGVLLGDNGFEEVLAGEPCPHYFSSKK